jgi:SAM-dependent methyltransferase
MTIVNFGCGDAPSRDCLNIDGSMTVLLARLPIPAKLFGYRAPFVAAIRDYKIRLGTARRLRFADASIDAFYSSHTLEHLPRNECEELLRKVHRWLKPNGVLRVVLPDLRSLASSYISGALDADTFMAYTHLATKGSQWLGIDIGHSRHCWMYDCDSFMGLVGRLGYRDIQRSHFGSSSLPQLASLDLKVRENASFYVEAVK